MSKRHRLSGYEYNKQRTQCQSENERLAQSISTLLTRDMRPCTCTCAQSAEEEPASESKASDADAIALELEVEQSVQQNVVQVAADHTVEDIDINERGADADCQLSEVFTDASLWPVTMTDAARIEIVTRETAVIQNKSGPFSTTVRANDKAKSCTRSLTADWFYRRLDNGEKVLRSWMSYILACSRMSLVFLHETYAKGFPVCKT